MGRTMARRISLTDDERVGLAALLMVILLLLLFAWPPPVSGL